MASAKIKVEPNADSTAAAQKRSQQQQQHKSAKRRQPPAKLSDDEAQRVGAILVHMLAHADDASIDQPMWLHVCPPHRRDAPTFWLSRGSANAITFLLPPYGGAAQEETAIAAHRIVARSAALRASFHTSLGCATMRVDAPCADADAATPVVFTAALLRSPLMPRLLALLARFVWTRAHVITASLPHVDGGQAFHVDVDDWCRYDDAAALHQEMRDCDRCKHSVFPTP